MILLPLELRVSLAALFMYWECSLIYTKVVSPGSFDLEEAF